MLVSIAPCKKLQSRGIAYHSGRVSASTKLHFKTQASAQMLAVKPLGWCPLNSAKLPGKCRQLAWIVFWGFAVPEIPPISCHQMLFLPSKSLIGTFKVNYIWALIHVICRADNPAPPAVCLGEEAAIKTCLSRAGREKQWPSYLLFHPAWQGRASSYLSLCRGTCLAPAWSPPVSDAWDGGVVSPGHGLGDGSDESCPCQTLKGEEEMCSWK